MRHTDTRESAHQTHLRAPMLVYVSRKHEFLNILRTTLVPKHGCNAMKIRRDKDSFPALNENTKLPWNGICWRSHRKEYSVFLCKVRSFKRNRSFAGQLDGKTMPLTKHAEMEEMNNWLAWILHLSLLISITSYSWNSSRILECLWIRLNNRMSFWKNSQSFAKTYYKHSTKGCL